MARRSSFSSLILGSRTSCLAAVSFALLNPLCGCVLVGGYRSGGGFFIWPGSIVLIVIALFVMLLLRRR